MSGAGLTGGEGLLGRVAGHVHPAGDKGHLILGVRPQVPNGVLVIFVCEVDGGAVPRHILDAIGELDAIDLSQGLEPGDQCCGVSDISHLDLAGGVQACDKQGEQQFQRSRAGAGAEHGGGECFTADHGRRLVHNDPLLSLFLKNLSLCLASYKEGPRYLPQLLLCSSYKR